MGGKEEGVGDLQVLLLMRLSLLTRLEGCIPRARVDGPVVGVVFDAGRVEVRRVGDGLDLRNLRREEGVEHQVRWRGRDMG